MSLKQSAQQLAQQGRFGDSILAHITPEEAALLKSLGGSGTINPETGLPEYWGFGGFFSGITNAISDVVDTVGDIGQGAIDTVSNVVSDVGESPLLPLVANYFVPGSGAYIAAAQTLDQGGSLEDALAKGATVAAAMAVGSEVGQATGNNALGASTAGATSAALTGGDPFMGALTGGFNYGLNAGLDQLVNGPTYSGGTPDGYSTTRASDYTPGSGYDFKPEYELSSTQQNLGLNADAEGEGLRYSTSTNLAGMGGGQGMTAEVPEGTVSQVGFTPTNASPNLGDPGSFINNPDILGGAVAPVETFGNLVMPKFNWAGMLLAPSTAPHLLSLGSAPSMADTVATGATQGALPKELSPTFLEAMPTAEATDMSTSNLPQLFPTLAGVDPRLMQVLAGRIATPSYYNYGQPTNATSPLMASTITGMPAPGIPVKATSNAYSPLSAGTASGSGLTQAGLAMLGGGGGGLAGYAAGGDVEGHNPQFITGKTGYYVRGEGDGQSDSIPAMLADGEYVFDADTVAALGNGSNEAGARILDKMRENLRKHKRSAKAGEIPPPAKSPLEYMKG